MMLINRLSHDIVALYLEEKGFQHITHQLTVATKPQAFTLNSDAIPYEFIEDKWTQ